MAGRIPGGKFHDIKEKIWGIELTSDNPESVWKPEVRAHARVYVRTRKLTRTHTIAETHTDIGKHARTHPASIRGSVRPWVVIDAFAFRLLGATYGRVTGLV